MDTLELTREVTAPSDVVWQVLTDLEGCPSFISGIESVKRLDDRAGFGVGTRWRETRVLFGKRATEEMEVSAVDERRSYTVEADGAGAHYVSTMGVEATGEGRSRLVSTFGAVPTGAFSRLRSRTVGKLFEGATRKAMEQDLDDIAAEAERRARS